MGVLIYKQVYYIQHCMWLYFLLYHCAVIDIGVGIAIVIIGVRVAEIFTFFSLFRGAHEEC